jgi:hypothetical protein
MNAPTVWLSCGVVRAEMEALRSRGAIDGEFLFMDSMLHMDPPRLEAELSALLEKNKKVAPSIVLVYGDCAARMLDLVRNYNVGRVAVINCAQLLVGRERYRQLMREEAFLILPEWARRWEEIMKNELGLNEIVAPGLMGENRRVLVYLDTGLVPVPASHLIAFSSYTGLPWRVDAVPLDAMLAELLAARDKARPTTAQGTA